MPEKRWEIERSDPGYPRGLLETTYPPARLYGIGDRGLLRPGLGVVGARRATPYGLHCAREFAGWAASAGVVIVSGAAVGCDLEAHKAALDVGGPTVAVLGCGADVDYPASARDTLRLIRDRGAVVSELPWGTPPTKRTFVPRNRIIAGLSAALLVVEAGVPSGTFSTADYALDADRDVLAVPGSVRSPWSRGPNRLLCQGATPITEVSDLAAALRRAGVPVSDPDGRPAPMPEHDPVLAALLADPMRPDDLAVAMGADIIAVARRIAALEERGLLVRHRDGRYGPPAASRSMSGKIQ